MLFSLKEFSSHRHALRNTRHITPVQNKRITPLYSMNAAQDFVAIIAQKILCKSWLSSDSSMKSVKHQIAILPINVLKPYLPLSSGKECRLTCGHIIAHPIPYQPLHHNPKIEFICIYTAFNAFLIKQLFWIVCSFSLILSFPDTNLAACAIQSVLILYIWTEL